ncbi:DUF6207 family protein [Streptomyces sp. NBC_00151]|uniref:DUF6207 family protein n=1 Tax=Streptomyces sp. NBC_00151 TaxID=2975669 RepID=UPI002DD93AC8|nr:DUF6207 family protein [Streptomyces sp. NBC_00151]WRZ37027.1 DUF6207 family protein [Streptomyces sp. NBC_00151]
MPYTGPANETRVSRPGLVVDAAAADDTAPTFQQLLAADRWATVAAERTTRDVGHAAIPPPEAHRPSKGLPSTPGRRFGWRMVPLRRGCCHRPTRVARRSVGCLGRVGRFNVVAQGGPLDVVVGRGSTGQRQKSPDAAESRLEAVTTQPPLFRRNDR